MAGNTCASNQHAPHDTTSSLSGSAAAPPKPHRPAPRQAAGSPLTARTVKSVPKSVATVVTSPQPLARSYSTLEAEAVARLVKAEAELAEMDETKNNGRDASHMDLSLDGAVEVDVCSNVSARKRRIVEVGVIEARDNDQLSEETQRLEKRLKSLESTIAGQARELAENARIVQTLVGAVEEVIWKVFDLMRTRKDRQSQPSTNLHTQYCRLASQYNL